MYISVVCIFAYCIARMFNIHSNYQYGVSRENTCWSGQVMNQIVVIMFKRSAVGSSLLFTRYAIVVVFEIVLENPDKVHYR